MAPGAGDQTCSILLVDCPEIEENLQFVSGQKECNYGEYVKFYTWLQYSRFARNMNKTELGIYYIACHY